MNAPRLGRTALDLARSQPERLIAWVLIALVFAVPYFSGDPYGSATAALIFLQAILAMSVTVLFGYAGQFSFAYAALFGVGAYVATYSVREWGVPQVVGILLGGITAVVVGVVVAVPALRIRGLQLGLVTLAFSMAAFTVFGHISGYEGIGGIPYFRLGEKAMVLAHDQLLLLGIAVVIVYIGLDRLVSSRVGRRLLLLKVDEATAASVGMDVTRQKMLAFAASSLVVGLIGGLYPMLLGFLGPELFGFEVVTTLFLIVIVGGSGRLEGAILGAAIFGLIRSELRDQAQLAPLLYGVAMLLTLLLLPSGLFGLARFIKPRMRSMPVRAMPRSADEPPATDEPAPAVDGRPPVDPPRPAGRPLLVVTGLSKRFQGLRALDDVSLDVRAGEILALIGSNGAGKSTFINAVTGFLKVDEGRVVFDGRDVTRLAAHRRARLGLVRTFQFPVLVPELDVRSNLRVAAEMTGTRDAFARVDESLRLVGLGDGRDVAVADLPFGTQKTVDLARAHVVGSSLLMLDEPAAGLSPEELPAIAALLSQMRDQGIAVLLVEHNMSFVMPLADRVVVLDHGRVIARGTPAEIMADDQVLEAYLGQPRSARKGAS